MNDNNEIADFSSLGDVKAPQLKREGQGTWPDRSVKTDTVIQISVRGKEEVINRLRDLCHKERYSYGDMIEILLDNYDRSRG